MSRSFVCIFLLFGMTVSAQETYDLKRCIQYARQNNLTVKLSQNNLALAKLDAEQAEHAWYPTVDGRIGGGIQFGRTIDPTTNDFDNQTIGFNNFGISAGSTVYAGGRIRNNQLRSSLVVEATEADLRAQENTIALNIAQAYLQVVLNEEQLQNAENRLRLSRDQLAQTDKLIRAGALPANDSLEILSQIALDEQTIVTAQNNIELALLNLKTLMDLNASADIRLVRVDIDDEIDLADATLYSFDQVYLSALGTQPQIRAGELQVEAAKVGVDLARADFYPTVSVFGGLSTNWSSGFKDFANPDLSNLEVVLNDPVPVVINGETATFQDFGATGILFPNLGYTDQLNQNFGQNVGVSVNIPIYSQGNTRINVERAELNVLAQTIRNEQTKQLLKTDIQRALADVRAARRSLIASRKAIEAAEASFANAQRRYDLGSINTFVFAQARNLLDQAEVNLTTARYQYVFSKKVLDFYMGQPIRLE